MKDISKTRGKKHLPIPKGKFAVSCTDVMTEFSKDGLFLRLFYPSSHDKNTQDEFESWFPWIPHEMYTIGIASFVNLWTFIIKFIIWCCGGMAYVPAHWEKEPKQDCPPFPVIIFSHGFGASRFICSSICLDLASQGFLVAAIEHRDTSASATYYYNSAQDRDKDVRTWIPHGKLQCGPNHYAVRNKQVKFRAEESIKVMNLLEKLNEGTVENVVVPSKFNMSIFKNRLDLTKTAIMGHSFGGATSLLALNMDSRFKLGIILDGWMFPLKNENKLNIIQPLLFINSATFHIPTNLKAIQALLTQPAGAPREIYTIRHSTHETQTDSPFVMGYWLDWFKYKIDPKLGIDINNFLIYRFLSTHIGFPKEIDMDSDFQNNIYPKYVVEGTVVGAEKAKRQFLSLVL